jgi:hypothetical protein
MDCIDRKETHVDDASNSACFRLSVHSWLDTLLKSISDSSIHCDLVIIVKMTRLSKQQRWLRKQRRMTDM